MPTYLCILMTRNVTHYLELDITNELQCCVYYFTKLYQFYDVKNKVGSYSRHQMISFSQRELIQFFPNI